MDRRRERETASNLSLKKAIGARKTEAVSCCSVTITSGFMPPSMATLTSDTMTAAATLRQSMTATGRQPPPRHDDPIIPVRS